MITTVYVMIAIGMLSGLGFSLALAAAAKFPMPIMAPDNQPSGIKRTPLTSNWRPRAGLKITASH